MLRSTFLVALFAIVFTQITACSEIISGLNVTEDPKGGHAYKIVKAPNDRDEIVVQSGNPPPYEVVQINPDVIALESTAAKTRNSSEAPSAELEPLLPSDVPSEYRIGPGDILNVTVWDHPELTAPSGSQIGSDISQQGRLVAADGSVFYPYVGSFSASGMTAADLRAYLAAHLKGEIQNPQVDVRVISFRAKRVQVSGEVNKPGTVTLDDTPKGVLQAIDACSGLTPAASRRRLVLFRSGKSYQIDFAGLLSGERPVSNPKLEPGDVIHVPDQSGDVVYVLGEVDKPQPVIIPQAYMSLIGALTQSGGLDKLRAKDSGVLVFRLSPSGPSSPAIVYTLDLDRPEGILLASQFQLQPRDVVYVKATAFAKYNTVILQLLPTVEALFYLNQLSK